MSGIERWIELDINFLVLEQVEIDTVVAGSYSQVVRFLNGLQRSPNVYAVQAMDARTDGGQNANGKVRVQIHIKTYFRTT